MAHARSAGLIALALLLPAASRPDQPDAEYRPPAGPPADVALWQRGQATGEAVVGARAEAGRLQQRARSGQLVERLRAAEASAAPGQASALRALASRLQDRWTANYELMSRRWPVDPTRVCWYQMLAFGSALEASGAGRGDLGAPRQELVTCVERADLARRELAEANHELAEAIEEAERALAGLEPRAPGAGAAAP